MSIFDLVAPLAHSFSAWLAALGGAVASRALAFNLSTALLLVGAFAANHLLERRVAASTRMLLFAAVFLRLLVPHDFTSPIGVVGARVLDPIVFTAGAAPAAAPAPPFAPVVIGVVYLAGLGLLLLRWLGARRWLARELRSAWPACPEDARSAATGAPLLYLHDHLGPLVAGVLRPRIVVPSTLLASADPETVAFVLAHETAHVQRRDHWLAVLLQLGAIVAWPVLPLWLAARQMRGLMELACDERVLAGRSGEQRRRYGELLLALSIDEPRLLRAPITPAFGWDLRTRVRALRRAHLWRSPLQRALVAALGGLLLACSGAEAPPMVSEVDTRASAATPAGFQAAPAGAPRDRADQMTEFMGVMRANLAVIKACYEGVLKHSEFSGRVDTAVDITAEGRVRSVKVSSTPPSPMLAHCLQHEIRLFRFPASGQGYEASFPMILQGKSD